MKKYFLILTLGLIVTGFFFLPQPSQATVRCETQYAGEVCVRVGNLQINKVVWDPERKEFVDNLDVTDHRFAPGEEVVFQIRVKNVGDAALEKVTVRDKLPFFLELTSGSLSFEIADLTPGETEEREIKTRVVSESFLSKEQNVFCDVNEVEAEADEMHDKDTVKVCISRKVPRVTVLPPTGFRELPLVLFFSTIAGAAGGLLVFFSRQ